MSDDLARSHLQRLLFECEVLDSASPTTDDRSGTVRALYRENAALQRRVLTLRKRLGHSWTPFLSDAFQPSAVAAAYKKELQDVEKSRDAIAADIKRLLSSQDDDDFRSLIYFACHGEFKSDRASDDRSLPVYIDPGDASQELLTELLVSLAVAYRACGGSGLTIASDEQHALVGEVVQ